MKHTDDDMEDLKRLYAQAPDEEPPAALDAAILAQARSAVAVSASRSSAARWRAPLATAAVLVLSVIVVLNVQREQPEILSVTAPAPRGPAAAQDDAGKAPQAKSSDAASAAVELSLAPAPAPVPVPEEVRDRVASSELASRAQGSAQSETSREVPAPASPVSQAAPRLSLRADNARSEAGPLSAAVTAAKSTANMTAEQWLAHLVELKAQGRLQEFQDSLAEFRKRHPGYRIPELLMPGPAQEK